MSEFLPSSPQLMMLAAMGIMIWVLWRRSNKHFGRGGKAYEPPHRVSKLEQNRDLALCDAPAEITRWQVELHELARETKGEIDTKLALLQLLTIQANDATRELEQAIARAKRMGLDRRSDPLAALESWDASSAEPTTSDEVSSHPEATRIYTLADQGIAPAEIAARMGLPLGDIEIALSLRAAR